MGDKLKLYERKMKVYIYKGKMSINLFNFGDGVTIGTRALVRWNFSFSKI
jgi:hypothetical protein